MSITAQQACVGFSSLSFTLPLSFSLRLSLFSPLSVSLFIHYLILTLMVCAARRMSHLGGTLSLKEKLDVVIIIHAS